jgi:hypothetical protein
MLIPVTVELYPLPTACRPLMTSKAELPEMMQLVSQREDLRLKGITGSKTGRDQSEKGDEKRAHRGSPSSHE